MYDFGNARVAARRSRLLAPVELQRLADAGSSGALLAQLAAFDDWRREVTEVEALAGDPTAAVDAAVERHRGRRLRSLLGWYPDPARRLVAALVLPLDLERLLSVVRLRRAHETADAIAERVSPGALLSAATTGRLARARSGAEIVELAARAGVLEIARAHRRAVPADDPTRFEAWLVAAVDRRRRSLAAGQGRDGALVRTLLERDAADHDAAWRLAGDSGIATATAVDRATRLDRLDTVAALGRRDVAGVGAVAGYVAAVEAQALRVRAALAAASAGWTPQRVGEYLVATHVPASAVVRAAAGPPW
jgi:vacuolar-type H+-ATPase subunit C/Vma6